MAAFSALKKEALRRINDISGQKITTAVMGDFINNALEDWATSVEPLLYVYGWPVVAKEWRYDLPAGWMKPKTVMWYQSGQRALEYVSPKEFQRRGYMDWNSQSSNPEAYTIIDRDLWIGPIPSTVSNSTTISASLNTTATTILTADGTKFNSMGGVVKINSEIMQYQYVDTNTVKGMIRAQGGTSAASHNSGDTINRCDIVATYFAVPASLSSSTDTPAIEGRWHKTLLYSAISEALAALGREDESIAARQLYEAKKTEAKREMRRMQRDEYFGIDTPYSP